MLVEDNRASNRNRPHPNHCKVGDLYKPWYFYKNPATGCNRDLNQVCLLYKVEEAELDPNEIVSTSFQRKPSFEDRGRYLKRRFKDRWLTQHIEEFGQKKRIICTKHYIKDSPIKIDLLEDPDMEKIKCFEGHHRMVSCEELGIPVKAEIYHLYHMDTPVDWNKHYQSHYDDSFWSEFNVGKHRKPWFSAESLSNEALTKKNSHLKLCFEFINSLGVEFNSGVDIGCAEGAYTFYAHRQLGCSMMGVDSEAGRTIRGLLVKARTGNEDVNFTTSRWGKLDFSRYDFGMALSILHHMDKGEDEEFIKSFIINKKAAIIEARTSKEPDSWNKWSIKTINTKNYYENIFDKLGINYKLVSSWKQGRKFYVLWP